MKKITGRYVVLYGRAVNSSHKTLTLARKAAAKLDGKKYSVIIVDWKEIKRKTKKR